MKKKDLGFVFLITLLVIVIAIAIYLLSSPDIYFGPFDGTTSSRSFYPTQAKVNKPVTVNLEIDFQSGTPFYDLVEFLPDNFNLEYDGLSIPRPDLAPNAVQFLNFNPSSNTHSYVLVPDPIDFCLSAPSTTAEFNGIYLAPPEEPRVQLGESLLEVLSPSVTRTFSKSEVKTSGTQTVYLNFYPACESSYSITENIPTGWTITDAGGGSIMGNSIRWNFFCPVRCENSVISYKVTAPPTTGPASFTGQYQIPASGPIKLISGQENINVVSIDCTGLAGCDEIACQGEYCNVQQTSSCFGFGCVNSCTGRPGYYCGSACTFGDLRYSKGDAGCGLGICCQDIPSQTCEETGGYCVEDPLMQCPPGFTRDTNQDITCNDGEIPLGGDPYQICCTLQPGAECQDSDGDGYGFPGNPSCPNGPQEDCDDSDPTINPGANETGFIACSDYKDNNCDGFVDEPSSCDQTCEFFMISTCAPSCEPGYLHYYPGNGTCEGLQCCVALGCEEIGGACDTQGMGCMGSDHLQNGDTYCDPTGLISCCEYTSCSGVCSSGGTCPFPMTINPHGNFWCLIEEGENTCCVGGSGGIE